MFWTYCLCSYLVQVSFNLLDSRVMFIIWHACGQAFTSYWESQVHRKLLTYLSWDTFHLIFWLAQSCIFVFVILLPSLYNSFVILHMFIVGYQFTNLNTEIPKITTVVFYTYPRGNWWARYIESYCETATVKLNWTRPLKLFVGSILFYLWIAW